MKDNNLPLYRLVISDEEDGDEEVDYVALVEYPAIQKNFLAFNPQLKFAIQNEAEQIVSGPLMIADMPIYRRDEQGEYYVVFTAEEIKKIVQRFFKKGYQAKVNIEHNTPIDGVYMFESYIVDRKKGVRPMKGFDDISDGSWFGSFKVENESIWNQVVDGTFKGFSVEGLFKYERTPNVVTKDEVIMSEIIKILKQIEH